MLALPCPKAGIFPFSVGRLPYAPNPGDLIFFDWDSSGDTDHVGIVERVENGTIYTVGGNSSSPDAVRQQSYPVG